MPKYFFSAIQRTIDTVNDGLCRVVKWFALLMVLLMFAIVVLRYGFNLGWIAMQESVMYLSAMVFLLASAHTLRVNEHVRVDIFYRQFSPRGKAWVDLLGNVLLLVPVNIFVLLMSWRYVMTSWRLIEDSPEAGGLPLVFVLKSLILLFAFFMSLQGVAEIIRNALTLAQPKGGQR